MNTRKHKHTKSRRAVLKKRKTKVKARGGNGMLTSVEDQLLTTVIQEATTFLSILTNDMRQSLPQSEPLGLSASLMEDFYTEQPTASDPVVRTLQEANTVKTQFEQHTHTSISIPPFPKTTTAKENLTELQYVLFRLYCSACGNGLKTTLTIKHQLDITYWKFHKSVHDLRAVMTPSSEQITLSNKGLIPMLETITAFLQQVTFDFIVSQLQSEISDQWMMIPYPMDGIDAYVNYIQGVETRMIQICEDPTYNAFKEDVRITLKQTWMDYLDNEQDKKLIDIHLSIHSIHEAMMKHSYSHIFLDKCVNNYKNIADELQILLDIVDQSIPDDYKTFLTPLENSNIENYIKLFEENSDLFTSSFVKVETAGNLLYNDIQYVGDYLFNLVLDILDESEIQKEYKDKEYTLYWKFDKIAHSIFTKITPSQYPIVNHGILTPVLEKVTSLLHHIVRHLDKFKNISSDNKHPLKNAPQSTDPLTKYSHYIQLLETDCMIKLVDPPTIETYNAKKEEFQQTQQTRIFKLPSSEFKEFIPINISLAFIYELLSPLDYEYLSTFHKLIFIPSLRDVVNQISNQTPDIILLPEIDDKELTYYQGLFDNNLTDEVIIPYLNKNYLPLYNKKVEVYQLTYYCNQNKQRVCAIFKGNDYIVRYKYPNFEQIGINDNLVTKIKNKIQTKTITTLVFNIEIDYFDVPTCDTYSPAGHANMALYNTTTNILELFDPHGIGYYDKELSKVFEHYLKTILQLNIKSTLTGVTLCEYLENGPQSQRELACFKNGTCMMWSYFYLFIRLLNSDIDPSMCMMRAIQQLRTLTKTEKQNNPDYCYILRFARHLIRTADFNYFVKQVYSKAQEKLNNIVMKKNKAIQRFATEFAKFKAEELYNNPLTKNNTHIQQLATAFTELKPQCEISIAMNNDLIEMNDQINQKKLPNKLPIDINLINQQTTAIHYKKAIEDIIRLLGSIEQTTNPRDLQQQITRIWTTENPQSTSYKAKIMTGMSNAWKSIISLKN